MEKQGRQSLWPNQGQLLLEVNLELIYGLDC